MWYVFVRYYAMLLHAAFLLLSDIQQALYIPDVFPMHPSLFGIESRMQMLLDSAIPQAMRPMVRTVGTMMNPVVYDSIQLFFFLFKG